MKQHILSALREQLNCWEELLDSLSQAQLTAPLLPSDWSTKDFVAHLMIWQQISVALLEAAVHDREPEFPKWVAALNADWEDNPDQTNAWTYQTYHDQPWSRVRREWRDGFLRFLELGEVIAERDLLDSGRYAWLKGHRLAVILLASYDHHEEHLEELLVWMRQHGIMRAA